MNYNDDNEDFFENSEVPEVPQKPKQPELKPEDPDYWEQTEDEFEHLRPNNKFVIWSWLAAALACIAIGVFIYIRYFSPCVSEATQYGYVDTIEKRGSIFNTYEGTIIPYKEIMDTTRIYKGDFVFSVKDAKVATRLKQLQYANLPARVEYKKYHAVVPWRGESRIVVIKADTADPAKILPPDFAPRRVFTDN
ncbi:MAG: hypothetical protein HDR94_00320 [Bacteroides sp.]|nr:hypothetical protein [Bacteroides sp.]